jgi:hypothetical protein
VWPIAENLGIVDRLTPDEIRDLYGVRPPLVGPFRKTWRWQRWQKSEQRSRLIVCNIPIALRIAPRFVKLGDDACSVAMIGLCNGVDLFNPDRGFTIATYLSRVIKNELIDIEIREVPWIYVPPYLAHHVRRESRGREVRYLRERDAGYMPFARQAMKFGGRPVRLPRDLTGSY